MIDDDDLWSNWWNEIWQGKPKYSEKTFLDGVYLAHHRDQKQAFYEHGNKHSGSKNVENF
jgi:hypothetical protein